MKITTTLPETSVAPPVKPTEDQTLGLGAEFAKIRHARDMSQKEVGDKTGLSASSITNIERGMQKLSVMAAHSIAQAMGMIMTIELTPDPDFKPPALPESTET